MAGFDQEDTINYSGNFFLNSSFLGFALLYKIANDNRLILVDIFIKKE